MHAPSVAILPHPCHTTRLPVVGALLCSTVAGQQDTRDARYATDTSIAALPHQTVTFVHLHELSGFAVALGLTALHSTALFAQPSPRDIDRRLTHVIESDRLIIARDLEALAAIPSPSGAEHARAALVADRFRALGLSDVRLDSTPNVLGRIRGSLPTSRRRAIVFVATLDDLAPVAVHQRAAPQPPRTVGDRVVGPGTHTSSTTAAMLGAIRALRASGLRPEHDLVFAAVAQEETGLKGMQQLFREWRDSAAAFIDILGDGRSITYGAIGIHWWQVWAYQQGGHSLSGGTPNVNQGIARAVDRILALPQPPPSSRTVLNISMIRSGDVFNRKPDSAWFSVDIRSLDASAIARNEASVRAILDSVSRETGTRFDMRVSQRTPGGQIRGADTSRLVRTSVAIANSMGIEPRLGNAGSSNLNVPIGNGTLAIGLGGERGGLRAEPGEFADIPAMLRTAIHVARLAAALGMEHEPH
jgi:acetylornithine deacetylase/succinyl-diaminopimelate desuccinylase-like protein